MFLDIIRKLNLDWFGRRYWNFCDGQKFEHILNTKELIENSVVSKMEITAAGGKKYKAKQSHLLQNPYLPLL